MTGCSFRVAFLIMFVLAGAWLGVWRLVWSTGVDVESPPQNIIVPPPKPVVAD